VAVSKQLLVDVIVILAILNVIVFAFALSEPENNREDAGSSNLEERTEMMPETRIIHAIYYYEVEETEDSKFTTITI